MASIAVGASLNTWLGRAWTVQSCMAGERRGQGIRGRLNVYGSGKALVSGLGEAVMDRALADVHWLTERLADVEQGRPLRAKAWGQAAFARAPSSMSAGRLPGTGAVH